MVVPASSRHGRPCIDLPTRPCIAGHTRHWSHSPYGPTRAECRVSALSSSAARIDESVKKNVCSFHVQ